MKKFFMVMVACGLMATAANAAWIEIVDTSPEMNGTQMQVQATLVAGENLLGFNLRLDASEDLMVNTVVNGNDIAGWDTFNRPVDALPYSFNDVYYFDSETTNYPADVVNGPGTFILENVWVDPVDYAEVTFNTGGAGSEWFYYDGSGISSFIGPIPGGDGTTPTLYSYGAGSSTDPFIVTPEPATLALVALGGLALIRRR